jgi:hypothetical protein
MRKLVVTVAFLGATSVLTGCVVEDRNGGGYHRRGVVRRYPDSAWEVVRNDPCRYREYQDYAREHKNPEKRRRYAEKLAREGCRDRYRGHDARDHRYDDPYYEPYRR